MKFYAVKKGRTPGIYRTWAAAEKQITGFSGAEYKSFTKITDATEYLNWNQETVQEILQPGEDTLQRTIAKIQRASRNIKPEQIKPSPQPHKQLVHKPSQSKPVSKTGSQFATIYTDGGTRNTGNYRGGHVRPTDKAAWAYLIEWQEEGQLQSTYGTNGEFGATNNKMELTALIEALKKLLKLGFNKQKLLFVLDSQYVLKPITEGWLENWKKRGWHKSSKGEIANLAGWQELDNLLGQFTQPQFAWTKGHANNRGNEFVDHTLNKFMDQM